jgi:hypothetical protein
LPFDKYFAGNGWSWKLILPAWFAEKACCKPSETRFLTSSQTFEVEKGLYQAVSTKHAGKTNFQTHPFPIK